MRAHFLTATVGVLAALALPALASDGLLELNQEIALAGSVTPGDTPGFPIELFTPGSFRLTGNLTVPGSVFAGINVYAAGTRIDLNGFTISSVTSCTGIPPVCTNVGTGIGIDASGASDVVVRNGRIAGFGVYGLFLSESSRAESLTVESNGNSGVVCEQACVVADSIVRLNGGGGIQAGAASRLTANVVHGNGGPGITAPLSALAERNVVSANVGASTAGHRNRRFYLTAAGTIASGARTACAAGFHMASLWEIQEPTLLTYDSSLGYAGAGNANDDLGAGPVSGGMGWIRTGYTSILTPSGAGQEACTGWSDGTINKRGSTAALRSNWAAPGASWPWELGVIQCNFPNPVWCVED